MPFNSSTVCKSAPILTETGWMPHMNSTKPCAVMLVSTIVAMVLIANATRTTRGDSMFFSLIVLFICLYKKGLQDMANS